MVVLFWIGERGENLLGYDIDADRKRTLGLSFGRPWTVPKAFTLLRRPSPFPTVTTSMDDSDPGATRVDKLGALFLQESM